MKVKNKIWYRISLAVSLYLFVGAFIFSRPSEILVGMGNILTHPSLLLSDYFVIGSIGGAMFNAGLYLLFYSTILRLLKIDLKGVTISGLIHSTGFALFGSNIYNSFALFLGAFLYGHYHKDDKSDIAPVALFATGFGPFVSYVSLNFPYGHLAGILLSNAIALFIGFCLPSVAKLTSNFHRGFSLYNVGMALGSLALIVTSIFRAFGRETIIENIVMEERNIHIIIYALVLFIAMTLPLLKEFKFDQYRDLLKRNGQGRPDFLGDYSWQTVLFNIGTIGLMATIYLIIINANFSGVALGTLIAVSAFGSNGVHLRNGLPSVLGVIIGSLLSIYTINDPGIIIAALLSTTLAPLSGTYGFIPGMISGFIHLMVVTQLGVLHGNLLLYNNGFTGGVVAGVMTAIFEGVDLPKYVYRGDKDLMDATIEGEVSQ